MTTITEQWADALADARAGRRVGIVATIGTSRRALLDVFERIATSVEHDDTVRSVRRLNGAERIDFHSGGSIRFVNDPRGIAFHRIIPIHGGRS